MTKQWKTIEPHVFVIFGATGDLMDRKIAPSLFHLARQGAFNRESVVLGVARTKDLDDQAYRRKILEAVSGDGTQTVTEADKNGWNVDKFYFQSIAGGEKGDFENVKNRIQQIEKKHGLPGNRIFYLALPPGAFGPTIEGLGSTGLDTNNGWTRLVIEKPFGRDLQSAQSLNKTIHRFFDESQMFRIDHYLGKETVQNLLAFRFGNALFEPLWNRERIQRVQIVVAEDIGVGHRAGYYDTSGAIRDMIQNHLTQLLCLTAMEIPAAFDADAIRTEKVKVLRSAQRLDRANILFGQYSGGSVNGVRVKAYRDEKNVPDNSQTETFVALKVLIDNWRWQGVPFYLVTGKRLPKRITQIIVTFRRPPVSFFSPFDRCEIHSNKLVMTMQPDEGFDLSFEVKAPGQEVSLKTQKMRFRYEEAFGKLPNAYETLLHDIMERDQMLFVRSDEVEESWKLYAPLLEDRQGVEIKPYAAGTWGPEGASAFLDGTAELWGQEE